MRTRRQIATPIIAKVVAEVGVGDLKALRKALREAYPWGQRRYWPYKVWCSEVRRAIAEAQWEADNPEAAAIRRRWLTTMEGSLFFGLEEPEEPQTFTGLTPRAATAESRVE